MTPWKTHVDNSIFYKKEESIKQVLSELNKYHDSLKFTCEIEKDGKLPFLGVLIILKDSG